ncbi:hypothetical protein [Streptosporangium vulgare]|uniref:hypothetical protein n=1 Tax=Streptosporangium vulgare TaxID=46190 RepID=UPI0031D8CD7F
MTFSPSATSLLAAAAIPAAGKTLAVGPADDDPQFAPDAKARPDSAGVRPCPLRPTRASATTKQVYRTLRASSALADACRCEMMTVVVGGMSMVCRAMIEALRACGVDDRWLD